MQAHSIAPGSPEPMQALASLKYEAGNAVDSLALLRRSMQAWWKPPGNTKAGAAVNGDAEMAEMAPQPVVSQAAAEAAATAADSYPADARVSAHVAQGPADEVSGQPHDANADEIGSDVKPSYEFRLECCKLLIELDDTTSIAIEVRFQQPLHRTVR
jgi:hypothetical protein